MQKNTDQFNGISSFKGYQHLANLRPFMLLSAFSPYWITLKLNLDVCLHSSVKI